MEYGPRALGNRSILADPGHPEMRDRINAMVKKREAFRPFAPACTVEEANQWFDLTPGEQHPYMISVVDVLPSAAGKTPRDHPRERLCSTADGKRKGQPGFLRVAAGRGKTTGRQMVLNTSFNVKGQPIVNTPEEAIQTFLGTGIEFLFLENFHVTRTVL